MHLTLTIPPYALDMLRLNGQPIVDPEIALDEISAPWELRWGHAQGSLLAQLEKPSAATSTEQAIAWNGTVRIYGHVEASHLMTLAPYDVMLIEVMGHPVGGQRLPTHQDLQAGPHEFSPYRPLPDETFWYSFLLWLDSPLVDFAHHALVNGQAIDCYGSLAPADLNLQTQVAMPLLLDSLTLYGGN